MTQTEQHGLNQRELSAPVPMEDFSGGSAKIAAELSELRRIVTGLCYHVGQLSSADMVNRKIGISPQIILYETFVGPKYLTLTGGAVLGSSRVILTGENAAGAVKANYYMPCRTPEGANIRCWLHHRGGSVSVAMNGIEMVPVTSFHDVAAGAGIPCTCQELQWTGPGSGTLEVALDLNCGEDASMEVYDFYMAFL